MTVPISRPSITAPGLPPGGLGQEVLLEVEQGGAHRRDGGDLAGGLPDDVGADGRIAGPVEIDGLGAAQGIGLVVGIALGSSTLSAVSR